MESFLKADVFFFVTTLAVIVVAGFAAAGLAYLVATLRDLRQVARIIKQETGHITEDVHALRDKVKREGMRLTHLLDFGGSIASRAAKRRAARKRAA